MMPEQLPAITQDLGVQKDAKDRVKGMLTFHRISYTTLTQDIEKLAYDAMMSGIQTGFNYGWRLGQNRLLEQQKKDRVFQTRIAKTEYVDEIEITVDDNRVHFENLEKLAYWLGIRHKREINIAEELEKQITGKECNFTIDGKTYHYRFGKPAEV